MAADGGFERDGDFGDILRAMDQASTDLLHALLSEQPLAALGTLHRGDPQVSMVPIVLCPRGDSAEVLIHVSALATHTRDMLEHPIVSLMLMGRPGPDMPPQACPRVTLQARARQLAKQGPAYQAGRAAYLQRFADAQQMFELGDFSLFALEPTSLRLVAGFGRAHSLVGEAMGHALRAAAR